MRVRLPIGYALMHSPRRLEPCVVNSLKTHNENPGKYAVGVYGKKTNTQTRPRQDTIEEKNNTQIYLGLGGFVVAGHWWETCFVKHLFSVLIKVRKRERSALLMNASVEHFIMLYYMICCAYITFELVPIALKHTQNTRFAPRSAVCCDTWHIEVQQDGKICFGVCEIWSKQIIIKKCTQHKEQLNN